MPIRTDTGRFSAPRRLLLWPLRSPRHAMLTAVIVGVILFGVGALAKGLTGGSTTAAPPATFVPSAAPPVAVTIPPATATAPTDTATKTTDPAQAARDFVRRWARPAQDTPRDAWMNGVVPYVAPEARVELKSIDPRNVPASKVTGKATVRSRTGSVATVRVPTDADPIDVTLLRQRDTGQWLVSRWEPATG